MYETAADSETVLLKPEGIQEGIDKIIEKYKNSRAFVRFVSLFETLNYTIEFRPSGTENILRVYAESQTLHDATAIADAIRDLLT